MNVEFARRVRHWRNKLGMTRIKLAERMGVSHDAIYRYETAQTFPHRALLVELYKALGVTEHEFWGIMP